MTPPMGSDFGSFFPGRQLAHAPQANKLPIDRDG